MPTQLSEAVWQYIAADSVFQLVSEVRIRTEYQRKLLGDKFRLFGCLQLENAVWQLLIDLKVGILGQAVIAAQGILGIGLKELLLHRDSIGGIDPEQNPGDEVVSEMLGFRNQLQLFSFHSADHLGAEK